MTKAPGFTLVQHGVFGRELHNIFERLVVITEEVCKAYPGQLCDLARISEERVDSLQSYLHDKVCAENPGLLAAGDLYTMSYRPEEEKPTFAREFASTGTLSPSDETARPEVVL